MSEAASNVERLSAYLGDMPPQSQALLLRGIELARLNGEHETTHSFLLAGLRHVIRQDPLGTAFRIFREPFQPFLASGRGSRNHRGWICRESLSAVWRLLVEAPGRETLRKLADDVVAALLEGDYPRARALGSEMRRHVLAGMDEVFDQIERDAKRRRQLALQLGGKRALEDLADIAAVLRLDDRLARLAAHLPPLIDELTPELVDSVLADLDDRSGEVVYPLVLIYRRLSSPAQILRLLIAHDQSEDPEILAASRLADCAAIVLADLDFTVERIAALIDQPARFETLLSEIRHFYSLASGMSYGIDVDSAPNWRARLSDQRRRASDILTAHVAMAPGAIRRAVKPQRNGDRPIAPDPDSVAEAERAARLMMALRPYRGEFAVNEVLADTLRHVESYLETVNATVLHDLRTAQPDEREAVRAVLDAVVLINAIVFGQDYAALLRRSGRAVDPQGRAGMEDRSGAPAASAPPPAA